MNCYDYWGKTTDELNICYFEFIRCLLEGNYDTA
jgi:hypothetical protein